MATQVKDWLTAIAVWVLTIGVISAFNQFGGWPIIQRLIDLFIASGLTIWFAQNAVKETGWMKLVDVSAAVLGGCVTSILVYTMFNGLSA